MSPRLQYKFEYFKNLAHILVKQWGTVDAIERAIFLAGKNPFGHELITNTMRLGIEVERD